VGECVNLSWSAGGGTAFVRLKRDGQIGMDNAPLNGTGQDCPPNGGNVTYRLEAVSSTGEVAFKEETIVVEESAPPSPVLIIHRFTVSTDEIKLGECVMLSWKYEGTDLALVRLMRNDEVIVRDPPGEGTHQDCPPAAGQMIYRLILDAEDGTSANKAKIVNVHESEKPPSPPPLVGTWQLRYYFDGQNMVPVLPGAELSAVFAEDGNLTGSAGCNTYSALYQVDGDALSIGSIAAGRQTCGEPEGVMEQESAFLAALQSATHYRVADEFRIFNSAGQPVLRFVR